MVDNVFSPKPELFARLRQVFLQHESGMLTVLTDNNRSVLMRFSQGKLISARCRSWDIANTLEALQGAAGVKFSFMASAVEDKPELMPAQDFMAQIDPDGLPLLGEEPAAIELPEEVLTAIKPEPVLVGQESFEMDRLVAARTNYF